MKKYGIIILIIVAIATVCIITCPNTQSHKEALIPMITDVWNQQYSDWTDERIKEIDNRCEELMKEPKPMANSGLDAGLGCNKNGPRKAAESEKRLLESWRSTSVGYDKVENFIDNNLVVKNYFLFSIGKIRIGTGFENISLGCFGHVFTISGEEFRIIFDVIHK